MLHILADARRYPLPHPGNEEVLVTPCRTTTERRLRLKSKDLVLLAISRNLGIVLQDGVVRGPLDACFKVACIDR